jgi:DNA-binding response OmpR family regulator
LRARPARVAEYGGARGWSLDVAGSLDEAVRLSRFRHYNTVISDESFEGISCTAGLRIARAAKRVDTRTRTIVLITAMSASIDDARQRGDVDVILLKPQPLSLLYAYASREHRAAPNEGLLRTGEWT